MSTRKGILLSVAALIAAAATPAQAVTVTLPDSSLSTVVQLSLLDTATVTVPATLTFVVNDITSATAATAAVTVTGLSLGTAHLQISLQANAAAFTPPSVGATTWNAGDISWTAGTWTNGTGSAGTLTSSAFNIVATCNAGFLVTGCNNAAIGFTLAAKPGVKISGSHTLTMTWKFASIP
jgi:hypothetical protein